MHLYVITTEHTQTVFIDINNLLMKFNYKYNFSNEFQMNLHFMEMCLNMQNLLIYN